MKRNIVAIILAVLCTLPAACGGRGVGETCAQMQVVYRDNPAFFLRDMTIVWEEKTYYQCAMPGAGRGREIGYATDEYGGWQVYEVVGQRHDVLMAVEQQSGACRIFSLQLPEKPWRQYILENATAEHRLGRLLSVTLDGEGGATLAIPPISSTAPVGEYSYCFEGGELLIFQDKKEVLARFSVHDEHTIVFAAAGMPLFADVGVRYVRDRE